MVTTDQQTQQSTGTSGLFDCNICLDTASNPVITVCGHLYCWPCVYKWMSTSSECPLCPICKAGLSEDKIIPLYGRGRPEVDPRKGGLVEEEVVPKRPAAHRPPASPPRPVTQQQQQGHATPEIRTPPIVATHRRTPSWGFDGFYYGGGSHGATGTALSAGLGIFPSFLGLQLVFPPSNSTGGMVPDNNGGSQDLSPEQAQQAFLSRLLLLLGSFVILCLLLF